MRPASRAHLSARGKRAVRVYSYSGSLKGSANIRFRVAVVKFYSSTFKAGE